MTRPGFIAGKTLLTHPFIHVFVTKKEGKLQLSTLFPAIKNQITENSIHAAEETNAPKQGQIALAPAQIKTLLAEF